MKSYLEKAELPKEMFVVMYSSARVFFLCESRESFFKDFAGEVATGKKRAWRILATQEIDAEINLRDKPYA